MSVAPGKPLITATSDPLAGPAEAVLITATSVPREDGGSGREAWRLEREAVEGVVAGAVVVREGLGGLEAGADVHRPGGGEAWCRPGFQ